MPYPASWVLFDQLFRQLDRGILTDAEYRSERWHLDLKYGELLHARGLLSAEELTVKRQALWQELRDEDAPVRKGRRASPPREPREAVQPLRRLLTSRSLLSFNPNRG